MSQAEEYEKLVEAIVSSQRFRTGSRFAVGRPSQWTVCNENGHVEFYNSPAEADAACARANARAALALIAETAKEWPTEGMLYAPGIPVAHVRAIWREMLAASPIVKPEAEKAPAGMKPSGA